MKSTDFGVAALDGVLDVGHLEGPLRGVIIIVHGHLVVVLDAEQLDGKPDNTRLVCLRLRNVIVS